MRYLSCAISLFVIATSTVTAPAIGADSNRHVLQKTGTDRNGRCFVVATNYKARTRPASIDTESHRIWDVELSVLKYSTASTAKLVFKQSFPKVWTIPVSTGPAPLWDCGLLTVEVQLPTARITFIDNDVVLVMSDGNVLRTFLLGPDDEFSAIKTEHPLAKAAFKSLFQTSFDSADMYWSFLLAASPHFLGTRACYLDPDDTGLETAEMLDAWKKSIGAK